MTSRRVLVLKEVGDESLLLSGFFLVPDPRYHALLGSSAYDELSGRIRDPLFRTLARRFSYVQGALREARRGLIGSAMESRVLAGGWARGANGEG